MRSRKKMRILVGLAAALIVLAAGGASAWVRVAVAPVARVGAAAAVGVAAGAVTGAAVASASRPYYYPPSTTTVVTTPPPAPAPASTAVGTIVTTLPSGCVSTGGRYQCGSVWYQPYFGGNGVYYQVVAP